MEEDRAKLNEMDLWHKARSFAVEAAKRSQELTEEAAKLSSELATGSSNLSEIVSETERWSKTIAAEASKRADVIRVEAAKRADQIKSLAEGITPFELKVRPQDKDLERFGITQELREFVMGITVITFEDFPLPDDSPISDTPSLSNVSQDLTEWQEKHANLVLSTVKEISELRYQLCPRVMRERKFWRIYFMIVNNHVAPYEKRYMEELKLKSADQVKDDRVMESPKVETTSKPEVKEQTQQSKTSKLSPSNQDLDIFLLGGDSDDDPGDDDDGNFDYDLDKMVDSSDDEKEGV